MLQVRADLVPAARQQIYLDLRRRPPVELARRENAENRHGPFARADADHKTLWIISQRHVDDQLGAAAVYPQGRGNALLFVELPRARRGLRRLSIKRRPQRRVALGHTPRRREQELIAGVAAPRDTNPLLRALVERVGRQRSRRGRLVERWSGIARGKSVQIHHAVDDGHVRLSHVPRAEGVVGAPRRGPRQREREADRRRRVELVAELRLWVQRLDAVHRQRRRLVDDHIAIAPVQLPRPHHASRRPARRRPSGWSEGVRQPSHGGGEARRPPRWRALAVSAPARPRAPQ